LDLLFPENAKYEGKDLVAESDGVAQVAIKRSKLNAFNDRDGISFYALREIKILQSLQSCKHVASLHDLFYTPKD